MEKSKGHVINTPLSSPQSPFGRDYFLYIEHQVSIQRPTFQENGPRT